MSGYVPGMAASRSPSVIRVAEPGAGALLARGSLLARAGGWACDLADQRLCWTDGVFGLFGLPLGAALSRADTAAMYHAESRETMECVRAQAIAACRPFTFDAHIRAADGIDRWMRVWGDVDVRAGRAVAIHGFKQDVSAERLAVDALRRRADHDALTGLANRAVFQARFLDAAPDALLPHGALVLFDVDRFKQINDRHGHDAGDACLCAIADRLADALPDAAMVARIGGDEFACVLPVTGGALALARRVERLLRLLCLPMPWRGELVEMGVSAGIAFADADRRAAPEAWFALADAALYRAKRSGRGRARIAGDADAAAERRAWA